MSNMKVGLLGRKLGMTQFHDGSGNVQGVTVIQVEPNTILQIKTAATADGYAALQLGVGAKKADELGPAVLDAIRASDQPTD